MVYFSCGKPGHSATRCPTLNESFVFMLPGWKAEKCAGGSRTRPHKPGRGEAQIMASRDGATAWPMAQPTPTSQTALRQPETVGVSAVLIETTPERSDRILSSVPASMMVMTGEFQPDDGTWDESGLLREAGGVLHRGTDFAGEGGGWWPLWQRPWPCLLRILLKVQCCRQLLGRRPWLTLLGWLLLKRLPWPMLRWSLRR